MRQGMIGSAPSASESIRNGKCCLLPAVQGWSLPPYCGSQRHVSASRSVRMLEGFSLCHLRGFALSCSLSQNQNYSPLQEPMFLGELAVPVVAGAAALISEASVFPFLVPLSAAFLSSARLLASQNAWEEAAVLLCSGALHGGGRMLFFERDERKNEQPIMWT